MGKRWRWWVAGGVEEREAGGGKREERRRRDTESWGWGEGERGRREGGDGIRDSILERGGFRE